MNIPNDEIHLKLFHTPHDAARYVRQQLQGRIVRCADVWWLWSTDGSWVPVHSEFVRRMTLKNLEPCMIPTAERPDGIPMGATFLSDVEAMLSGLLALPNLSIPNAQDDQKI